MLEAQGGRCAICRVRIGPGAVQPHIDHSHAEEVVRGVLCRYCNIAIGMMRDDPAILMVAAAYLDRIYQVNPPAGLAWFPGGAEALDILAIESDEARGLESGVR